MKTNKQTKIKYKINPQLLLKPLDVTVPKLSAIVQHSRTHQKLQKQTLILPNINLEMNICNIDLCTIRHIILK